MTTQVDQAVGGMRSRVYGRDINWSLLALFEPGARVLDIGCGVGGWAEALRQKGATELIGVELSPEAADIAQTRYHQVYRDPIERLDFTARDIDTIIAADVLEHLVDPFEQIARWRPWARQLVISVPNLQSLDLLVPLIAGRFTYTEESGLMDRTHLRWFTHRSLREALADAGWTATAWGRPTHRRGRVGRLAGGRADPYLMRQIQVVAE